MNVVIIEDEIVSSRRLERLLKPYNFQVLARLSSVKQSVAWFKENNAPDVLFLDIHLADGLCFEIFNKTTITCPIIFTTAYSDYSVKAFDYNSLSYLLKPINEDDLQKAINKATTVHNNSSELTQLKSIIEKENFKVYKTEFAVRDGQKIKLIKTSDITYFKSKDNIRYLNSNGKNHIINDNLSHLDNQLDDNVFFRVNRQYIINKEHIESINYKNNRYTVKLLNHLDEPISVSREKQKTFKNWINR